MKLIIMRNFILIALLMFFSINGVALAADDDVFEIESEGRYKMEPRAKIELAKSMALFTAKRKAVELAGRYLSRKRLIEVYELDKDEIYSLAAREIAAEILEEKRQTIGKFLIYRVRIKARVQTSDFVKAEMEDTKQVKSEAHESYHEEMEQTVSAEIDPGKDISKAYRLLRERKWRIALIYMNHLEKNTRTGQRYIWPKPLFIKSLMSRSL